MKTILYVTIQGKHLNNTQTQRQQKAIQTMIVDLW